MGGWIRGTFSLDLVHLFNQERSCDVLLTFPWDSRENEFGVQGIDVTVAGGKRALHSGHGGISAWAIRSTLIAYGPSFRSGTIVTTPVSQVDLVPTILHLIDIHGAEGLDGRVIAEALSAGRTDEQPEVARRTLLTSNGDGTYRAALQIATVAGHRYLDTGWRVRGVGPEPTGPARHLTASSVARSRAQTPWRLLS